jgi:hypothetical protein
MSVLLFTVGSAKLPLTKRLCDGGFYAVQIFKTAIAKPLLN